MKTPEEIKADEDAAAAAAAEADKNKGADDLGVTEDTAETIADLRKQLDDERAKRQQAERVATQSVGAVNAAAAEVDDANMQLVATAIDTVEATQVALKARYRDALSANDHDAAADINLEMANNAAKLLQLKNGKSALEEERKNPRRTHQPNFQDPVEALASTLTPKSADWVRAHPDYVTDARKNRQMIRAHEDAIDKGHAPDSPGYFKFVEDRLEINKTPSPPPNGEDATEAALSAASEARRRRSGGDDDGAPPPAMPASRGGGAANGKRLTPAEKEIADAMGMTHEDYAANKEALKKEGRLH